GIPFVYDKYHHRLCGSVAARPTRIPDSHRSNTRRHRPAASGPSGPPATVLIGRLRVFFTGTSPRNLRATSTRIHLFSHRQPHRCTIGSSHCCTRGRCWSVLLLTRPL